MLRTRRGFWLPSWGERFAEESSHLRSCEIIDNSQIDCEAGNTCDVSKRHLDDRVDDRQNQDDDADRPGPAPSAESTKAHGQPEYANQEGEHSKKSENRCYVA